MRRGILLIIALAAWALGVTLYLAAMIPAHAKEPEKKPKPCALEIKAEPAPDVTFEGVYRDFARPTRGIVR